MEQRWRRLRKKRTDTDCAASATAVNDGEEEYNLLPVQDKTEQFIGLP